MISTKRILAFLAAALLCLAGCGGNDKASEGGKITIGLTYVPDVQFAPFYVAEDKGYFKDEGVNVSLRHHGAQESLFGALEQGTEDVVVAGGDEMLQNRSNGIKVYNWATMYQTYPVKVIVPRDSTIRSAADLKGKTIGLPGKAGENYFSLQAMLKANGLTESDVKIQFIGYTHDRPRQGRNPARRRRPRLARLVQGEGLEEGAQDPRSPDQGGRIHARPPRGDARHRAQARSRTRRQEAARHRVQGPFRLDEAVRDGQVRRAEFRQMAEDGRVHEGSGPPSQSSRGLSGPHLARLTDGADVAPIAGTAQRERRSGPNAN